MDFEQPPTDHSTHRVRRGNDLTPVDATVIAMFLLFLAGMTWMILDVVVG